MKNRFNKSFWENKYKNNTTGWDIGRISTPLKAYFEQLEDTNSSILIPGGGNGYEAAYLHNLGFKNVSLLDIAAQPLKNFCRKFSNFPKENVLHDDFFNHKGHYDLIIEQTFFCALDPNLRKEYVKKISELLKKNGKLAGLLFNFPLTEKGPPFGGNKDEYFAIFSKYFKIKTLEKSYNSIDERMEKELFIIFEKR